MKQFIYNVIIKKFLTLFLVVMLLTNFIMPNYVHAADSPGEKLVSSFFYLIAKVGDIALSALQGLMMGDWDIQEGSGKDANFVIKYSPGIIFANKVPTLDINFINPNSDILHESEVNNGSSIVESYSGKDGKDDGTTYAGGSSSSTHFGPTQPAFNQYYDTSKVQINEHQGQLATGNNTDQWYFTVDGVEYNLGYHSGDMIHVDSNGSWGLRVYGTKTNIREIKSTAGQLQGYISAWYLALRRIALVGLLSVLVYIGIRIVLSSASAQDKAKYKNMLKDWLVAICIIFMLHYIMAFLLGITQNVNEIINDNAIKNTSTGDTDILMNTVRSEIGGNLVDNLTNPNDHVAGYTIMYLALVILTLIFTVQYLKRVIYMAFLTMVAPLIGLTYPLDKFKDGKAQAFSFWLREYIFNCLIQPVHLLLYTVLISSSISFATENIVYSIIALAFLPSAEKLIKEMFGMKSQSPSGTLGAAAGGAVVMSMLQKLKAKPPKEEEDKGPSGTRTPTRTPPTVPPTNGGQQPLTPVPGNGGGQQPLTPTPGNGGGQQPLTPTPENGGRQQPFTPAPGNGTGQQQFTQVPENGGRQQQFTQVPENGGGQQPFTQVPENGGGQQQFTQAPENGGGQEPFTPEQENGGGQQPFTPVPVNGTGQQQTLAQPNSMPIQQLAAQSQNTRGTSIRRGLASLGKRYIGNADTWKTRGKKFTRAIGGAALGVAAGTIALAAEVADGHLFEDPTTAFRNTVIGFTGGFMAGSNLTGRAIQDGKETVEAYQRGYYGEEEYNNKKYDEAVFKSDMYRTMENDPAILATCGGNKKGVKEATQQFLNNGITDMTKMKEYMQHGISGNEAKDYSVYGIDKVSDIEELRNAGVNPLEYSQYNTSGVTTAKQAASLKNAGIGADEFEQYNSAGISKASEIAALREKGITASEMKNFASAGVKDANKILKAKNAHPGLSAESLANRFSLAAHAPKNLDDFKAMMSGRNFEGHVVDDAEAETIFKQLVDFF